MWPEDEVYEQWRQADPAQKPHFERLMLVHARRHAEITVWSRLRENNRELIELIAEDVVAGLPTFRGDSQVGTWVEQIARNKVNDELRKRYRQPRHFVDLTEVEEQIPAPFQDIAATVEAQPWFEQLNGQEQELLRLKGEGWTDAQIAAMKGIEVDAAESRWRQLRGKIRKKSLTP